MRLISGLLLVLLLAGCVTVKVPKYLEDEFPYRKSFEANFQDTYQAALEALKGSGWKVTDVTNPAVFSPGRISDKSKRYEVLIFTEIKQSALFLGSNYVTLNALLRTIDSSHTEVEIRYLSMTVFPFKTFSSYQNDRAVSKVFNKIEQNLRQNEI